jgi:hypothetical protein
MAAQPPDPLIRLSLKYSMNALPPHVPLEYAQGKPLELNEGSEVSGLAVSSSVEFGIADGAPIPVGVAIGTMGACNSTCGSVSSGVRACGAVHRVFREVNQRVGRRRPVEMTGCFRFILLDGNHTRVLEQSGNSGHTRPQLRHGYGVTHYRESDGCYDQSNSNNQ